MLPVLRRYAPQLIIVSAGFDAHERDPLAGMLLNAPVYAAITERLLECARSHADGRIVHLLEGGYDLDALGSGVDAVLGVLSETAAPVATAGAETGASGTAARMARESIAAARSALAPYWDLDA